MSVDLKSILLSLYWLSSLLYFEYVIRLSTAAPLISPGLIYTFLYSMVYTVILFLLNTLVKGNLQWTFTLILVAITTIIFTSQLIYYKIFKMFYTFYSMGNAGQVFEFLKDILANLKLNFHWILMLFIPFAVFIFFRQSFISTEPLGFPIRIILFSLAVLIYSSTFFSTYSTRKTIGSSYDVYYNSIDPTVTVQRFGLLTTMRLDFQRSVLGMKSPIYNESKRPVYTKPAAIPIPDEDYGVVTIAARARNRLPIDFDALIAHTSDKLLIDMHSYFQNLDATEKNSYTGRFKGYNLILITAESFSPYSVHQDLTPTLYKMVHEGFQFTDFYNPVWGVSTSDGEYVACTGLLPKSGVWSFLESANKSMPMTMGNALGQVGYTTSAYHNHTYNYYKRNLSHPNMGYNYKGLGNGLNVTPTWPESDLEMIELTVPEFVANEPFHVYYMTVSGHMRYSFSGNAMAAKNKDLVKDLPYATEAKAYLATQIELDRAMASLLSQLENAGVAEHTLIAMSADHYPYALSDASLNELAGHKVERNFELYKSPFVLYAPGMTPEIVDKPCSSLDIIPTLLNLFGLDYDARLLAGRDIFSNADPLVIFLNKSFITDKGRYNTINGKFIPKDDSISVDANYIRSISKEISDKFYYSAKILDKDYYKRLDLNQFIK